MSKFKLINNDLSPIHNPFNDGDYKIIKESDKVNTIKVGMNPNLQLLDRQMLGGKLINNVYYIGGSRLNKIKTDRKTKNFIKKYFIENQKEKFSDQLKEIFEFGNKGEKIMLEMWELFHNLPLSKNLNTIIDTKKFISGTFDGIHLDHLNKIIYIVDAKCSIKKINSLPKMKYIGLYETYLPQIQIYMYLALNFYVPREEQQEWKLIGYLTVLNYQKHYFYELKYEYNIETIQSILKRVQYFHNLLGGIPKKNIKYKE